MASVNSFDARGTLVAGDGKVVLGSMNRSGLAGARYAVDDRVTAYDVPGIVRARLDGGKLLLRIDPSDPSTPAMLERTGQQVSALAAASHSCMCLLASMVAR